MGSSASAIVFLHSEWVISPRDAASRADASGSKADGSNSLHSPSVPTAAFASTMNFATSEESVSAASRTEGSEASASSSLLINDLARVSSRFSQGVNSVSIHSRRFRENTPPEPRTYSAAGATTLPALIRRELISRHLRLSLMGVHSSSG